MYNRWYIGGIDPDVDLGCRGRALMLQTLLLGPSERRGRPGVIIRGIYRQD